MTNHADDSALPPPPLPTVSNRTELFRFLTLLGGERTIGVIANEELSGPISPEVQAYLIGKFGASFVLNLTPYNVKALPAYASFFHSIAKELDKIVEERTVHKLTK